MSAEVRLHSEGCRERIRQAMVDDDMGQQRFQDATEAPGTKRSAEEQGDRGEVDQEERMKRTKNLHTLDKARKNDAKKAKEEVVTNVSVYREKVRERNQHEHVLRSEQHRKSRNLRGGCSAWLQEEANKSNEYV